MTPELIAIDDINPETDSLVIPGTNITVGISGKKVIPGGRVYLTTVDGIEIDAQPDHKFWVVRA